MRGFISLDFIRRDPKARFACMLLMACAASAAFLFVFAGGVAAQEPEDPTQNFGLDSEFSNVAVQTDRDIKEIIALIINITLGFLGIVAVLVILYAGYMWMTAAGNEEQVAKAKLILRNAVIGLVIVLMSWGIAAFVIRQLGAATGAGDGPGDGGGGLPPGSGNNAAFVVASVETSRIPPFPEGDSKQNVTTCSSIQTEFNHYVGGESFEDLKDGAALGVFRTIGGVPVKEGAVRAARRNNAIAFKNESAGVRVDWLENTTYDLRLATELRDGRGLPLSNCADCDSEEADYWRWTFTTGTESDEIPPSLMTAFPSDGETNVPRPVVFSLVFSEPIDAESLSREGGILNTDNIKLQRKDPVAGAFDPPFSGAMFDVSPKKNSIIFWVNANYTAIDGEQGVLDPYTEYRLIIQNLEDQCGNALDLSGEDDSDGDGIADIDITFETGADMPGVSFVRPSDGYGNACTATPVFLKFNTSMYNVRTQSCSIDTNGLAGLVLGGTLSPAGVTLRTEPEDNFTGTGNPNDFCKTYNFNLDPNDAADDLIPEIEYAASVDFIKPGGDVANPENHSWSFNVAPAGRCANEPYINYVSSGLGRNQGQWEQCLTIQGRNFDDPQANAHRAYTALSLASPLSQDIPQETLDAWQGHSGIDLDTETEGRVWTDTSIPGDFIAAPAGDLNPDPNPADFNIQVSVSYPFLPDPLPSNAVRFTVDTTQAFSGPCLYSANPNTGYWGDGVTVRGSNLGDGLSQADELVFYDQKNQSAQFVSAWNQNAITANVPNQSQNNPSDGEVHVTVDGVSSNKLEYNLEAGIGESCALDPDICAPGLECNPETLTCQVPDTFRIVGVQPSASCTNSCANALISFETSKPIAEAGGNRVQVKKCPTDERCAWSDPGAVLVSVSVAIDGSQRAVVTPQTTDAVLDRDSWYMARVAGGTQGVVATDGKTLANLNADTDAVAGEDAYVWAFKTGSAECRIERIEMDQHSVGLYEGEAALVGASAYGPANSCAPSGQELTPPNDFTWKACEYIEGDVSFECQTCSAPEFSGSPVAEVAAFTATEAVVAGVTGSLDGSARALACAFYDEPGISLKDGAAVTVNAPCTSNDQCVQSGTKSCPNSICLSEGDNAGKCTPVVNDFNPKDGAPGTWVTIDGCYFGNEWGAVEIGKNYIGWPAEANEPSAAWCGATWSNFQIIAEVADDAAEDGPVRVLRPGFDPAGASGAFDANGAHYPGICRVYPSRGRPNTLVDIKGQGFTSMLTGTDEVRFTDIDAVAHPTINVVGKNISSQCPEDGWDDGRICVRVVDTAAAGEGTVSVSVSGSESNAFAFTVLGTGSGGPPGANDLSVVSYAPGEGSRACLNMVVEATLSGEVDPDSVGFEPDVPSPASANFYVRRPGDNSLVDGVVSYRTRIGKTVFSLYPDAGELATGSEYEIVLKGGTGGLHSASGGVLEVGELCNESVEGSQDCVIGFSTVNDAQENQCRISHVEVEPSDAIYTCAGNACPGDEEPDVGGHQRVYEALAVNNAGQATVINTPVSWSSSDGAILLETSASAIPQTQFIVQPANGSTIISAAIDGTGLAGSTEARVFLCENPWPESMLENGAPYNDKSGGGFTSENVHTNFSTFYCRDSGEPGTGDDLPDLGDARLEVGVDDPRDVDNLLKELFFIQPSSTDAIGIRVLSNTENRSIREWYDSQPKLTGNPTSITPLDNFPALQDGRTVYVGAPNDTSPGSGAHAGGASIYNNIYLISVNDNPSPETVSIFNQMVSNWRFLVNLPNQEAKSKFRDDMARIRDAHAMIRLFKNKQPKLDSGSFKQGLSLSTWPSWSQVLSSDLGAQLPVDPVNKIYCEGENIDQNTCWSPASQDYVCKEDAEKESHFYLYQYEPGKITLQMNLAYGSPAAWNSVLEEPGAWDSAPGNKCSDLMYEWPTP